MDTLYSNHEQTRTDTFATWGDFTAYAASPCDMTSGRVSQNTDNTKWYGTVDYAEALDMAAKGWSQGAQKATDISHSLEERLFSLIERHDVAYDVTGEILDVGRYCAGTPEHWGVFETTLVEGPGTKYVHIVVAGSFASLVDADVIIARGAVISALVHTLELAGHRCKVSLVIISQGSANKNYKYECRVPIKEYTEHLDIDLVTYALAHPSTFRRHGFAAREHLPEFWRQQMGIPGGYGRPCDTDGERGDIYVPVMGSGEESWTDKDKAAQWVTEHLVRLGVIKEGVAA